MNSKLRCIICGTPTWGIYNGARCVKHLEIACAVLRAMRRGLL